MKNISRRVFIKGLAVAGVAAAASTVLAGCNTNMIPGVDDGNEDDTNEGTTGNVQTVTLTDQADGKTVTLNITKVEINTLMNQAVLSATVKNELGDDLFVGVVAAATKAYGLTLAVEAVDKDGVKLTAGDAPAVDAAADPSGVTNLFDAAGTEAESGSSVSGVLVLDTKTDKWAKITVTATLSKWAGEQKDIDVVKFDIKNV